MLAIGLALGWFAGNRGAAAMRAERDARAEDFRKAIIDLAGAEERARAVDGLRAELVALRNARDGARTELSTLKADARAFEARLTALKAAKDVLASQFTEGAKTLPGDAPNRFITRPHTPLHQH